DGLIEATTLKQTEVFEAAVLFAKTEGIIPAPETAHAIKAAINEAIIAKEEQKQKNILICFSGHGHFDMAAYDNYLSGSMQDAEFSDELIEKALKDLPQIKVN
ncbi:MAG: TrpB-like pyridoxal-phosphate dependent enzyme, partial [Desulfurella sp.]